MLTVAEREQIRALGREPDAVESQLALLRGGPRYRAIERPCALGDGILRLDAAAQEAAIAAFDGSRFGAFVPASGAASRLFSNLGDDVVRRVRELALWGTLGLPDDSSPDAIRDALIDRWAAVPKGLIPFHPAPEGYCTAIDEHLSECVALGVRSAHFTVGPEHLGAFKQRVAGAPVDVTFSVQDPGTDTVAVDAAEALVRDDGAILFRPGGHGALMQNVEDTRFELALIKNIDNVVPEALRGDVVRWRRIIGGTLVRLLAQIRGLYSDLMDEVPGAVERAARFADQDLAVDVPHDRDALVLLLDRPVRVCGMVPNDGQPGGGPFFIEGSRVPQIIESAEVDPEDERQQALWRSASHFNPVDMAVALTGPHGAYDLERFSDPAAAIVTRKTHEGRSIVVLEHPGLWNGRMARWNTVFVELPRHVFQPVKTLADLLGDGHRST